MIEDTGGRLGINVIKIIKAMLLEAMEKYRKYRSNNFTGNLNCVSTLVVHEREIIGHVA